MSSKKNKEKTSPAIKFKPIYSSLEQLFEQNKGIFKLFRKSKTPGLLRAIWDSREGEIESLRIQLSITQKELQSLRELRQTEYNHQQQSEMDSFEYYYRQERENALKQSKIDQLNQFITNLKSKLSQQNGEREKLQETLFRYQSLNQSLEVAFKSKEAEILKEKRAQSVLEGNLDISHMGLTKLNEELTKLQVEIKEWENRYKKACEKLEKLEVQNRNYKRLNRNMETELFRVNEKLERTQSLHN